MRGTTRWLAGCILSVVALLFVAGCEDGGDGNDPGWVFDGASDALDGRYTGRMTTETETLGLMLRIDQVAQRIYGQVEAGDMAGDLRGSFSGNDITFRSDVAGGGRSGNLRFSGRIHQGLRTLSGTFTGVLNGVAVSGTWSASR